MKNKKKENKMPKVRKKLSTRAKKIIVLGCFCTLLLVTGGVNIYMNSLASADASGGVTTTANFFSNYKSDRTETRNQEMLYLDAIIASEATSATAKANAESEKLELISSMEVIMRIENLITAKGFSDVAVATSKGILTVMVETDGLTSQEVAQITDIVVNNSDYSYDNIKIIEV